MAKYILKGSKGQGEVVGSVQVDEERTMVRDGEPVELTEDEHKTLSQSYQLRKAPEEDSVSSGEPPPVDGEGNEPEKGGDK